MHHYSEIRPVCRARWSAHPRTLRRLHRSCAVDPSRNPAAVAAQWTPGFSVGGPPTQVTRPHPQTLYTPDALGMPWGGGGALPLPSRAQAAFHPAHSASTPHHLHVNQGMPHKATPGYTMPPHGQPGDPLAPGMAVSWGTARSLSGEVASSHMQASEVQAGRAESQWLAPVATRSSGNTPVHSEAPFPQRSWPGSGWMTTPHGGMGMPPPSPTAAAPASWAPARTVSSLSGKRPRQEANKDLPPGHFTGSPTPPPADGAGTASHVQDPTAQWQPAAKAPRAEGSKCRSLAVPQQVQGEAAHAGARVEGGATRPALVQPSHLPVTTVHPAHRNGAAASQAWASAPVML